MTARTSDTHPLRIDCVEAGSRDGRIGMTLCPGKKQRFGITGAWARDLAADLAAVQAWGAQALVTLVEPAELENLEVPSVELADRVEALGLEWHHLPIPDGGVPDAHFEKRWIYAGTRLRRHLAQGRSIVLHCIGGLGRTGTIAARLLVEFGADPEKAIGEIRQARPGAIETTFQERHVRGVTQLAGPGTPPSRIERALGCVLGGAVGDAFGYAVEFDSLVSIQQRYGERGIRNPALDNGRLIVSDDTQMTLFTMEGLLRALSLGPDAPGAVAQIRLAYLDWLLTQGEPLRNHHPVGTLAGDRRMVFRRAPGNTCLAAMRAGGRGTVESPVNDSKGCGGVMRVAPIGLLDSVPTAEDALKLGAAASAITHGHVTGYLSGGAMAAMVHLVFRGATPDESALEVLRFLCRWDGHDETSRALELALELASEQGGDVAAHIRRLGLGWVGEEALAIGVYACLVAEDFADAVAIAANHDGDSDSTASIAGQIWGAWRGLQSVPHEWIRRIDVLDPALTLLQTLTTEVATDKVHAAVDWAISQIDDLEAARGKTYVDEVEEVEPGVFAMPAIHEPAALLDFHEGLHKHGLVIDFDWAAWEEGRRAADDPDRIRDLSPADCVKLLTAYARSDRFCDGAFSSALDKGHLTGILKRMREHRRAGMRFDIALNPPAMFDH